MLDSVHATHRFASAPFEPAIVCRNIEGSLHLRSLLSDPQLQHAISGISSLLILLEMFELLMQELASDEFAISTISDIIESDIGLTATLLKMVNSPYYGLVQHVKSPAHAVNLLGVEVVKNIMLSEDIVAQVKHVSPNVDRVTELNVQANIRGVLANRFARLARLRKRQIDHCHLSGALSTLGELVIETCLADSDDPSESSHYPANVIGSSILDSWLFPDAIVEAVLHQTDEQAPADGLSAFHILHAVRRLETVFDQHDQTISEDFNVESVFVDYPQDADLLVKWFDCFCDYHLDIRSGS